MDPLDIRRTRPAKSNLVEPAQETASQTAGPYVHIGCLPNMAGVEGVYQSDLKSNLLTPLQNAITVKGQVFDGNGDVCKDIMLEFWQAGEEGDYSNGLWHRSGTDLETGTYEFSTVMPGSHKSGTGETCAPFISVWIVARGINLGLHTRIYFPEHEDLQKQDPHLRMIDLHRRKTVICEAIASGLSYRFDIHLQGNEETVFFDV